MLKTEKQNIVRANVVGMFKNTLEKEFTQVDSATYVIPVTDPEGSEHFVEVKFVVKGDSFDLMDAEMAYEDKLKKAQEREAARREKAAEKAAKEAAKASK